jgi:hypothetical protein
LADRECVKYVSGREKTVVRQTSFLYAGWTFGQQMNVKMASYRAREGGDGDS